MLRRQLQCQLVVCEVIKNLFHYRQCAHYILLYVPIDTEILCIKKRKNMVVLVIASFTSKLNDT